MQSVTYATLNDLIEHPITEGVTFICRHAERHPLNGWEGIISADLTESGRQSAFDFGERLQTHYHIQHVATSPIWRCFHTAKQILAGARQKQAISAHWWLYSPFLTLSENNNSQCIYLKRHHNDPTQQTTDCYDKRLLGILLKNIHIPKQANTINLYIAHDSTILPLIAYLYDWSEIHVDQFPDYLEGIALIHKKGMIQFSR